MRQLLSIMFLFVCLSAQAATLITATVTVTNTAGTTNGQTITVNGDTRTWATNVTTAATQILTGTNLSRAVGNMLYSVAVYPFDDVKLSPSPNGVKMHGAGDSNLVVSVSAGWATVAMATNTSTEGVAVTMPLSDSQETILRGAVMVNDFPFTQLYPSSNGTNFALDFSTQEFLLTCTNNVHLSYSTNWPAATSTRFTAITIDGDSTDRLLTWNTNWLSLGTTNTSGTIPADTRLRVSFMITGLGETNIMLALPVGSIDSQTATNIATAAALLAAQNATNALGSAAWLTSGTVTNAALKAAQDATNNIVAPYVSGTLSNQVSTAGTIAAARSKSTTTNAFILPCPNGGSFIITVGDDGTLNVVTNTAGL